MVNVKAAGLLLAQPQKAKDPPSSPAPSFLSMPKFIEIGIMIDRPSGSCNYCAINKGF